MIKNATTLLGDCKELLKDIPDQSVDAIITDPPYNISKYVTVIHYKESTVADEQLSFTGEKYENVKLRSKSADLKACGWDSGSFDPLEVLPEFKRILKPKGNIAIFTSPTLFGTIREWVDTNFDLFNFGVWYKINPLPRFRKTSFLSAVELVCFGYNSGHTFNFKTQNEMHNVFKYPILGGNERLQGDYYHPTQKPIKLMKHLIEVLSNEGETVIDPFMGTGSTGVAALECNRKFIGIEKDQQHYETSIMRLSKVNPFSNDKLPFED